MYWVLNTDWLMLWVFQYTKIVFAFITLHGNSCIFKTEYFLATSVLQEIVMGHAKSSGLSNYLVVFFFLFFFCFIDDRLFIRDDTFYYCKKIPVFFFSIYLGYINKKKVMVKLSKNSVMSNLKVWGVFLW